MPEGQVDTGRITHLPQMHRHISWKQPVRAATTASGTLSTAFDDGSVIDGVTLATDDRILLKNQSDATANGIYVVNASGVPSRVYDFDDGSEAPGALVYVMEGTTNAGTLWRCTNTTEPVLGTDNVTWSQFTGSGVDLTGVDFLVGTATGLLSSEIVAGTSPGGELGGTWASPTVDATHSGSPHSDFVAKADDRAVNIVCDGAGSVISTGVKAYFQMPASGHWRAAKIIAKDASSSAVFDVWVRSGNVPTVTQTITASAKPTLTSAQLADPASTLSGWTTAFSANDWVGINLDSVTTATLLVLTLYFDWT